VEGVSTAVAVTAGGNHTCALLQDQTLACWGENTRGQVGDGSNESSALPVALFLADVQGVAAGGYHTCAYRMGGELLCWGANDKGQLGDDTVVDRNEPGKVVF
jgi:alpha-tubulin suppressor-like RCC1 family protein